MMNDLEAWCNDLTIYGISITIDDEYVPWSDVVTLCEEDVITVCYKTEDGLRYANSSNNFIQIERF